MTERSEWRQEAQVDSRTALLGRIEKFWERFPFPLDTLVERIVGNRLDVGQIPCRDLARLGLAGCDADAAISHDDRSDSVPGSAADKGIPTNLRVIMGMRIDEAGRHDKV